MFERDWTARGSCVKADHEMFFGNASAAKVAKRICMGCPVRRLCLQEIMACEDAKYRSGVWGGTGPRERNRIAAARKARTGRQDAA